MSHRRIALPNWLHYPLLVLAILTPPALATEHQCTTIPPQTETASFRFEPSPAHDALTEKIPEGTTIATIRVQRFRVFDLDDPEENNRVYRWANDFHRVTREWVVREHLLVREGDPYNASRLEESGRLLRDLDFIYDARVRPWRWCGDSVDLEVITRDIWTFIPIISLSRSGGTSDYRLGFRDTNFLGTGKSVTLRYDKDDERSGTTLHYSDPALLGSRWRFRLRLTDNDDGYDRSLRLVRPFFSIYERWSLGGLLEEQLLEEKIWFRGDEVAEFDHEREQVTLFGGIAIEVREGHRVGRWLGGYNYEAHEFDFSDSDIPPPQLPEDRTYSYPYVGYQSIEDEYAKDSNLNYLGRTEDLYVGEQYHWNLGFSSEALGATRDQAYLEGYYGNTLWVDSRQWWTVNTELSGFWSVDDSEWENLWWFAQSQYIRRHTPKWALFSRLRLDYTNGLTLDQQLTLGGDNGLRGYDRNYQVGDRSYLFNIEERYYSDWHPFRLFRVGAAVFFDIGRAWFEGEDNGSNGGTLYNAGLGLRLNSSRAEKSAVIHIDLAFPLVKDDDVDDMQFLIRIRDTF